MSTTDSDNEQVDALKIQGAALLNSNRLEEARELYSGITTRRPEDAEAWYLLSSVHGRLGRVAEAAECCRRAIALRPDYGDAYVNLGNVLMSQQLHDEALLQYQKALQLNPRLALAHGSLGNLFDTLGRHDEAMESYLTAIRLDPNLFGVHYNLGNLMKDRRNYDKAVQCYSDAIRLNPAFAPAYYNLGSAFYEMGHLDRAAENFQRGIELNPDNADAHNQLGIILKEKGHLDAAKDAAAHALQLDPGFAEAYITLGDVYMRQNLLETALEMFQKALTIHPDRARVQSCLLMTMHYISGYSREDLFNAANGWDTRLNIKKTVFHASDVTPDPAKRLRIGYVSADLWQHPVGYFIEPVLTHHDRSQYEVFCYYNNTQHDLQSQRLHSNADHWCNITGKPDEEVVRQINKDRIDILVDLSGHTAGNRLPVFIHKPAPLQVTWLGYYDTTGLAAMDYIIADRFVIPDEDKHLYVERVAYLPHSYISFSAPHHPIDVSPPPAASTGKITFGCFNNPNKIGRSVIAVWSRLLRELPEAQLHLKSRWYDNEALRRQFRELFAEQGITASQIVFSGNSPRHELLSTYNDIDIALDPFPYNGGTTTLEALWMGVPVICLKGDRFVSRVGQSILTAAGFGELVAETLGDYIEKTVALAADLPRLTILRKELRGRLMNSPLCAGVKFTRALESEYRNMWHTWCATRAREKS